MRLRRVLQCLILLVIPAFAQMVTQEAAGFRITHAQYDSSTADIVQQLLIREVPRLKTFFDLQAVSQGEIVIAPNEAAFLRYFGSDSVTWAAAAYFPHRDLIVLRSPRWAGSLPVFERDVLHELVHFYVDQRYQKTRPPIWLNEGLAQHLSYTQISMADAVTISGGISGKKLIPLDEIDSLITFHRRRARLGYLQSLTAVRFIETRFLPGKGWPDFHRAISEFTWPEALERQTGMSPRELEVFWYRDIEKRYEWMWILNPETLLLTLLVLVFLITAAVVRFKKWRRMRRWEDELDFNSDDEREIEE